MEKKPFTSSSNICPEVRCRKRWGRAELIRGYVIQRRRNRFSPRRFLHNIPPTFDDSYRRKIRLTEGIAKCRHPKKLTYNFAAGVYFSEAQNPIPPPPLTHSIREYSIHVLIHTGKRGRAGELNQREVERGNSSQSWVKNNNMIDCIFCQ